MDGGPARSDRPEAVPSTTSLAPLADGVSRDAALAAARRVAASRTFKQSEHLRRLLDYLVERTLDGKGAQLKEYTVGIDVFRRVADFDPRADPVVRVEARRLRAKLQAYYADEGRQDDVAIDVPKGHYVVRFSRRSPLPQDVTADSGGRPEGAVRDRAGHVRHAEGWLLGIGVLAVALAGFLWEHYDVDGRLPPTVLVAPLGDVGDGASRAALGVAIAEEVTGELVALRSLKVVSPGPGVADARPPLRRAREAGATWLVEGSVQGEGERVRVAVHVVRVSDERHVWVESFDGTQGDLLSLRVRAARAVRAAMERLLARREADRP